MQILLEFTNPLANSVGHIHVASSDLHCLQGTTNLALVRQRLTPWLDLPWLLS